MANDVTHRPIFEFDPDSVYNETNSLLTTLKQLSGSTWILLITCFSLGFIITFFILHCVLSWSCSKFKYRTDRNVDKKIRKANSFESDSLDCHHLPSTPPVPVKKRLLEESSFGSERRHLLPFKGNYRIIPFCHCCAFIQYETGQHQESEDPPSPILIPPGLRPSPSVSSTVSLFSVSSVEKPIKMETIDHNHHPKSAIRRNGVEPSSQAMEFSSFCSHFETLCEESAEDAANSNNGDINSNNDNNNNNNNDNDNNKQPIKMDPNSPVNLSSHSLMDSRDVKFGKKPKVPSPATIYNPPLLVPIVSEETSLVDGSPTPPSLSSYFLNTLYHSGNASFNKSSIKRNNNKSAILCVLQRPPSAFIDHSSSSPTQLPSSASPQLIQVTDKLFDAKYHQKRSFAFIDDPVQTTV